MIFLKQAPFFKSVSKIFFGINGEDFPSGVILDSCTLNRSRSFAYHYLTMAWRQIQTSAQRAMIVIFLYVLQTDSPVSNYTKSYPSKNLASTHVTTHTHTDQCSCASQYLNKVYTCYCMSSCCQIWCQGPELLISSCDNLIFVCESKENLGWHEIIVLLE